MSGHEEKLDAFLEATLESGTERTGEGSRGNERTVARERSNGQARSARVASSETITAPSWTVTRSPLTASMSAASSER